MIEDDPLFVGTPCAAGCLEGLGAACHARTARVPRYCVLIHELGREDYRRLVREKTGAPPAPAGTARNPPYESADEFLAPIRNPSGSSPTLGVRPWEGVQSRKPWEYRITAAIVHIDTPGLLAAVLATLRAQAERPYLMVIDAGSLAENRWAVEDMELASDDMEVHYLRPRAWRFTSQPVAVGMDLAFAMCQTEYMYATHTDVFLKRPDYLGWLVAQCDATTPAVGYQMSPREWKTDLWKRFLSHTASIYHMPTMHRIRATWNMLSVMSQLNLNFEDCYNGWPDTEVGLGLSLQSGGIGERWGHDPAPGPGDPPSVLMLGPEPNNPYETEWLVHERSYTGHRIYCPEVASARRERVEKAAADAIDRAARWIRRASKPRIALGMPQKSG